MSLSDRKEKKNVLLETYSFTSSFIFRSFLALKFYKYLSSCFVPKKPYCHERHTLVEINLYFQTTQSPRYGIETSELSRGIY